MKILMISRDVKVLDRESSVFSRMVEYSNLFDELHIVVLGKKPKKINVLNNERLFIYDGTSSSKLLSFFKSFLIGLRVARKVRSEETWITSQDPFESGILALIIAKISKIKLQLQLHTDCFNELYVRHSLSNLLRFNIARIILPKADAIRIVSDSTKNSLSTVNLSAEQAGYKLSTLIHVLPIYTDVEKIMDQEVKIDLGHKFPEFKKIILIVARLESEKNIELSIHAFQKAIRFDDTLGLVIAGSGSKEKWLKKYTQYLGVGDKVRFLGWQSDVVSLYKTSDLLLVTSLYEGYGLNMLESVACGTPVVSTGVGVANELGASVVPYDAGQIALKIIEVLNQDKIAELPKKFIIKKDEYLKLFKDTFK